MHKNKLFYQKSTIQIKDKIIGGNSPLIMGIINLTPDSFFEGSRKQSEKDILHAAEKMISSGADMLDLGAYSSRPNAVDISIEEEWNRLKNIIPLLRINFPNIILSVDTFRAEIANNSLELGVDIINDISGGNLDENMFQVISKWDCPYVMMHMKGNPQNMQTLNTYENMMQEIGKYFDDKIEQLTKLNFSKIILDPGFGFAKNREQNFELLANLEELNVHQKPMLIGLSRKSMIYKSLNISVDDALNGTTALNMLALQKGADILRVHDVKEAVECVKLFNLIKQQS